MTVQWSQHSLKGKHPSARVSNFWVPLHTHTKSVCVCVCGQSLFETSQKLKTFPADKKKTNKTNIIKRLVRLWSGYLWSRASKSDFQLRWYCDWSKSAIAPSQLAASPWCTVCNGSRTPSTLGCLGWVSPIPPCAICRRKHSARIPSNAPTDPPKSPVIIRYRQPVKIKRKKPNARQHQQHTGDNTDKYTKGKSIDFQISCKNLVEKNADLHSHGDRGHGIHLTLYPRADRVSFFGKLPAHKLVILLLTQLLL